MTDGWYYTHDGERHGPFTGPQLRVLALSGAILCTDTVWREGITEGVPATEVKRLFPPVAHVPVVEPAEGLAPTPEEPAAVPEPAVRPPVPAPPHRARKLLAVAVLGATVVSQDGERVRFKKKCTTCRHEDSSWATLPITVGTMRVSFFCPKCRRQRGVELRGQLQ